MATEVILGHRRRNRWRPGDTTSEVTRRLSGVNGDILKGRVAGFVSGRAGSQPGHNFPASGGSRRPRRDTSELQLEFRRAQKDLRGWSRTRYDYSSEPCV